MSKFVTIVVLLGLSLIVSLLVILLRRRLYRRFPAFFAYCVLRVLVTIPRLMVRKYPTSYFLFYWITEAIYFVVSFAAMTKILSPFFETVRVRHGWVRLVLPGGVGLAVLISLLPAIFSPIDHVFLGRFASAVYSFVILMCTLEIALFVLVVRVGRRYGLEWSQYETGILAGFGALSLVTLFAYNVLILRIFHLRPPPLLEALYRYSLDGALIPAVIAWLVAFWHPEPPQKFDPPDLSRYPELAKVLEERSKILKELMKRFGLKFVGATPAGSPAE